MLQKPLLELDFLGLHDGRALGEVPVRQAVQAEVLLVALGAQRRRPPPRESAELVGEPLVPG